MTLTLWNLDHPAQSTPRFQSIQAHLTSLNSDLLVLTETNAALQLPGYTTIYCKESPFIRRGRNYQAPNRYYQVDIYAKEAITKLPEVADINGVLATVGTTNPLRIYGNVLTIKDRWATWSAKRYADRVHEQCAIIRQLHGPRFLVAGDFNFRGPGSYNKIGAVGVRKLAAETSLHWPTSQELQTVQQVLHSGDLNVSYEVVDTGKLSDHPIVSCAMEVVD